MSHQPTIAQAIRFILASILYHLLLKGRSTTIVVGGCPVLYLPSGPLTDYYLKALYAYQGLNG